MQGEHYNLRVGGKLSQRDSKQVVEWPLWRICT